MVRVVAMAPAEARGLVAVLVAAVVLAEEAQQAAAGRGLVVGLAAGQARAEAAVSVAELAVAQKRLLESGSPHRRSSEARL